MASNKTVIVTGASQGIGAAVVQAFLGRGYKPYSLFQQCKRDAHRADRCSFLKKRFERGFLNGPNGTWWGVEKLSLL